MPMKTLFPSKFIATIAYYPHIVDFWGLLVADFWFLSF